MKFLQVVAAIASLALVLGEEDISQVNVGDSSLMMAAKRRRKSGGSSSTGSTGTLYFVPEKLKKGQCLQDSRNSFPAPVSCACQSQCHIYGDPHLSPFETNSVKYVPPPANTGRSDTWDMVFFKKDGILIYGKVTDDYVKQVYFNGALVADVASCLQDQKFKEYTAAIGQQYHVHLEVQCTQWDNKKAPPHLNSTVTLTDYLDSDQGTLPDVKRDTSSILPDGAEGYCVNGKNVALMQSSLRASLIEQLAEKKKSKKRVGTDGRQCSCRATCAAWGDPHVQGFDVQQRRDNIMIKPEMRDGEPMIELYSTADVQINVITGVADRIEVVRINDGKTTKDYVADEMCNQRIGTDLDLGTITLTQSTGSRSTKGGKGLSRINTKVACEQKNGHTFFNICIDKEIANVEGNDFRSIETEFGSNGKCFGKNGL